MKDYIRIIILAVGAGLAVGLTKYLHQAKLQQAIDPLAALGITIVFAVIVMKVLELALIELPMRLHVFRRIIDPKSQFEGSWLLNVDELDERPISFGHISYNVHSGSYDFDGLE
ncbi:MAG TPA: hypothetical protein VNA25_01415 [Phycisphaerae bacterium]|nr:hypothetical protein [Phycisphaerae bacterium]